MTSLEKECDALWRVAVKKRDNWHCRVPNCYHAGIHAHHIFPRSRANTRYDLDNGITFCQLHHDHDHPGQLSANVRECISYEEYDRLYEKAQTIKIWHEPDLKELREKLKEMV